MNIPINQPHDSIMPIKFSLCATNPCAAAEPCTRTSRVARPSESCITNIRAEPHEPPSRTLVHPSRASRTAGPCIRPTCHTAARHVTQPCIHPNTRPCIHPCTRPCIRPNTLGRAYTRALGCALVRASVRIHPQSCSSHLELVRIRFVTLLGHNRTVGLCIEYQKKQQ